MQEDVQSSEQVFGSHTEFYRAVYAGAVTGTRTAGTMGGAILQAQQQAGDWSDAATPDLVIAVMTSEPVPVTMDLGAGKFACVQPKGSFILISPHVATKVLMDGPIQMQSFSVPYGRLLAKTGEIGLPLDGDFGRLHAGTVQDRKVTSLIRAYCKEASNESSSGSLAADALVFNLAGRLLDLRDKGLHRRINVQPLGGWRLSRAKDYLADDMEEQSNVAEIAQSIGLSTNYFITAFGLATGLSPQKFRMSLRIERAQKMLGDPDGSILSVAMACGFKTSQHFATVFREIMGDTPSAYRREKCLQASREGQ